MKYTFQRIRSLLCVLLVFPFSILAQAENEPLVVSLSKDFGYAAGGEIQGSFSLKVRSPEGLARVEYYLDGELIASLSEAPFRYEFNTADFELREHTFFASGYFVDGRQIQSSEFSRMFISAEQSWKKVGKILVPLLVGVALLTLLGSGGSVLLGRKKVFKLGEYGIAGGVICPRCAFPYARNLWAPNMLVGKLQRCPHCGKWAIVPRASTSILAAAEERFRVLGNSEIAPANDDAEYRKMIDDSRFES
ncbi:MAG: Ig-like domain-containing protein [Chloroflexi bacterium]|nr:Ig-like domain-containing protein [Chloroflexota bacterium]